MPAIDSGRVDATSATGVSNAGILNSCVLMLDRHQRLFCGRGFRRFLGIAAIESIDTARRVNQFLLAGKKRMTRRANFDVQIAFTRRTRLESFAAGAGHCDFFIFRMNSGFHSCSPCIVVDISYHSNNQSYGSSTRIVKLQQEAR